MINELIKLSTHLDERGLTKEADYLDGVIKKAYYGDTAWAKHEKLSEELRIDAVAYLDKLKADRGMNPPKYGGYTCPKSIKWLPVGVIWTGDGKVVTKGEGEWR